MSFVHRTHLSVCFCSGGTLTMQDLKEYRARVSDPWVIPLGEYQMYVPPPPSGSAVLSLVLNIMQGSCCTQTSRTLEIRKPSEYTTTFGTRLTSDVQTRHLPFGLCRIQPDDRVSTRSTEDTDLSSLRGSFKVCQWIKAAHPRSKVRLRGSRVPLIQGRFTHSLN